MKMVERIALDLFADQKPKEKTPQQFQGYYRPKGRYKFPDPGGLGYAVVTPDYLFKVVYCTEDLVSLGCIYERDNVVWCLNVPIRDMSEWKQVNRAERKEE